MLSKRSASPYALLLCVLAGTAIAADPAAAPAVPAASGAVSVATPPAPVPERAAQQYAQALAMLKAGRTTDAELEFKQLIAAYPDLPGPQINLGLLLAHAARLPEAQSAFKAALAISPNNVVANTELGVVERRLGKFSDAEQDYLRAISADPGYAPARLNLGILYDLYLLEPQKALDQFEQYLTLAGENKQVAGWVSELRKRVGAPAPQPAKKETRMNNLSLRLAVASTLAWCCIASAAAQQTPAPTPAADAPSAAVAPAESPVATPAKSTAVPAVVPKKRASAQAEAGEPRAATSAPAGSDGTPRKGKNAADRVDLDTTTVTGNRELPKVMYVVPWKRSDIGDLIGRPANSLLDEVLAPVDRNVFRREVQYYQALKPDAAPTAPQVEK